MDTGVLYCDDNLSASRNCRAMRRPDLPRSAVLLEPHLRGYLGRRGEVRSFEDRWKGGIHHYIEWMRPRCEMHVS